MASTIVPGNVLDGVNASRASIRTQFTNAASDITALEAPQYVTLATSGTLDNERVLTGTSNQITITDGGAGSTVTLTISTNPVLPGTGSVTVPIGTTAQRPGSPVDGMIRYNSDTPGLEARVNGAWVAISTGGASGVSSLNSLTGALSIAVGTAGTDFAVSPSGATITLNLPSASAANRGVVTTGTQTFAGAKTFNGSINAGSLVSVGAVLNVNQIITYQGWGVDTPTTGQTVAGQSTNTYQIIIPAGTLAALTINLPTAVTGQVIYFCFQKAITTLTVTAQAGDTIASSPTTITAGQGIGFLYNGSSTIWYRIQ